MPNAGDIAPDFEAQTQDGSTLKLADLLGKKVVLYFYPKADTPGCTTESCSFRDHVGDFDEADAVIVGISPNTVKEQNKFAVKFDLPFKLVADADHAIAEAYGVWIDKTMYGKHYMGVDRTTFVIDATGKIATVFPKVKIEGHTVEVFSAVQDA